ncbi:hypothetical protein GE09DRAFT_168345 [Coniochaeta sp. 2T2.1]|nr:hypothetical protein GE09DRAFT_168345 [Coniochaeta sp. 2T2.1]
MRIVLSLLSPVESPTVLSLSFWLRQRHFLDHPQPHIMAEAFGLAASGIAVVQVAMVVGKSVIALRNLWNEVRDVPDSITHLMQQVDIMSISLGAMEQNLLAVQAIENCEDIVGPALEYARRARDEFVALVDELSREINAARKRKRVVARLKVVLGQNQLARCESRLRGAVQLLGFAQQTSAFALSARLPDLIAARIMPIIEKRDENSVLVLEDANGTYEDDDPDQFDTEPGISSAVKGHRDSTRDDTYSLELFAKSNPKSVYEVQVRAPAWLTRKVWEFGLSRATSGWQALIRTYNIIEPNSEVIVTLLSEVNPSKVIGLFETGLASPLDVDCDGYSILDVSRPSYSISGYEGLTRKLVRDI